MYTIPCSHGTAYRSDDGRYIAIVRTDSRRYLLSCHDGEQSLPQRVLRLHDRAHTEALRWVQRGARTSDR